MVRRNLLSNNILSEPQNEVCYEENQTYRFHKGNQGPYRFHETKGTIYSKKKNSTPRRLLWSTNMAAVFGLGPIMWPVMTSCEDNLIRTMLVIFIQLNAVIWIDGDERCDLVGHIIFFILTWSLITTKRVQQTPTC